jgi:hypothetical protein
MSQSFLSPRQREDAKVLGIKTNATSRVIAGGAGEMVILWDEASNVTQAPITDEKGTAGKQMLFRARPERNPVFIRVRNLHASEPLFISEDLRDANGVPICSAAQFTDVLAHGTATDDGTGAGAEWQKNRPSCVSIFGTNAWRAVVMIRYAE